MSRRDVLVIGAGVAGLACAERLARVGLDVLCVDPGSVAGGIVGTERRATSHGPWLLEQAPFNVLARCAEFVELLDELGDELEVVDVNPGAGRRRQVLVGGRLHEVPSSPPGMLTSSLIGRARALRGLLWSRQSPGGATIDDVVRRRFGDRIADRLVSAVTIGVWGVESDELEAVSAMPMLGRIDAGGRTPLRSIRRERRLAAALGNPRPRGMISFRGGLGDLPRALAARLGARLRLGAAIEGLEHRGDHWRGVDAEGREHTAAQVVVATGAAAAARLLPDLAPELRAIDHASLTVLNMGFRASDLRGDLDGYGFLVARTDRAEPVLGVLYASSVFPHHAPEGHVILRVFFGGTRHPELAAAPVDVLVGHALRALRSRVGLCGEPVLIDHRPWPEAVPVYRPGHAARVLRLHAAAGATHGLHLAGAYLDGVSVNDCVARGVRVAEAALQDHEMASKAETLTA